LGPAGEYCNGLHIKEATVAEIIDGKAVAAEIVAKVSAYTASIAATVTPGLATVLVGEDPASQVYVASKSRMAKECGFHSVQHTLPRETTQSDLLALVGSLNEDASIHGIL